MGKEGDNWKSFRNPARLKEGGGGNGFTLRGKRKIENRRVLAHPYQKVEKGKSFSKKMGKGF